MRPLFSTGLKAALHSTLVSSKLHLEDFIILQAETIAKENNNWCHNCDFSIKKFDHYALYISALENNQWSEISNKQD
jgi:hypothetical protein